ncbi:MAG: hypothetical protein ACLTZB_02785 [Streptococcus salivarius]
MSIGLLSKRTSLRVLAIISYLINVVAAVFGFNYVGFLTAVQPLNLSSLSGIFTHVTRFETRYN